MQKSNVPKAAQDTAHAPKDPAKDKPTPLEEKSHVFEHRHWVNEACGDDLWET